jgi:hypothetical protein
MNSGTRYTAAAPRTKYLDATREPQHLMPFREQNAGLPPGKTDLSSSSRVGLKTSFLLKSGYNWLQLELQKQPIVHIVFRVNIAVV